MKIALISDIHGAAEAYGMALDQARTEGFDALLILGDLLTYGPQPERCLDLTREAQERDGAVLVIGNHDQLYSDRLGGCPDYVGQLPDWIRESVEWTRSQLRGHELDLLGWASKWLCDDLLVAHANPYRLGDWSYLRSDADVFAAATALASQGFRRGIFGHVHRFAHHQLGDRSVTTIGSIGQPRDRSDLRPQWAVAEMTTDAFQVRPRYVDLDWRDHCHAIASSSLTEGTKAQLCRFFR